MKIQSLTLENFGIYSRQVFGFESAPLVLIYGLNESGKTTALNGIRQALFGFRPRTKYLTGKPMKAEVDLRMADGRRFEFSRRKARVDELAGTVEQSRLSADEIRGLLGNFDLDSYEHLFGFSLDELREGESALKSVRLSDALAGGSLGGIHSLQQLQSDLVNSLSDLYKARGTTGMINVKLAEIQKSQDALRQSQVLPTAVQHLREQLQHSHQKGEELRELHARVFSSRAHAKKLLEAMPVFNQRRQLLEQLEKIEVPEGIDLAAVASWSDYVQQRKRLSDSIGKGEATEALKRGQLNAIGGERVFGNHAQHIEVLGHRSAEIAEKRKRLVELHDQQEAIQESCAKLLRSLQLNQLNDAVREFSISEPVRLRLENIASEYSMCSEEIVAVTSRLDALKETILQAEDEDEGHTPENIGELSDLVEQLDEQEKEFSRQTLGLRKRMEDSELKKLVEQLSRFLAPGLSLSPDFMTPTIDQVQAIQLAMEENSRQRATLQRELKKLEAQLANAEQKLDSQEDSSSGASIAQYDGIAERRRKLLQDWIDELSQPLIAASITPHQQSERLEELQSLTEEGDSMQQQIIASAGSVAAFEQLRKSVHSHKEEIGVCSERLAKTEREKLRLERRWSEYWEDCPLDAGAPDVMLEWLQDFTRWKAAIALIATSRRELHISRGVVRELRRQLQDQWPDILSEETPTETMQKTLASWAATQRDSQRQQERAASTRRSLEKVERRLGELQKAEQELAQEYGTWLAKVPVTANWPLQRVGSLIDSLESLRREDSRKGKIADERLEIGNEIDRYVSSVVRIGKALNEEVASEQAESYAENWLTRLQESRNNQEVKIQLTAELEHLARTQAIDRQRLSELDAKIGALCVAAGAGDSSQAESIMQRVKHAEQIRKQVDENTASLKAISFDDGIEHLLEELASTNAVELEVKIGEYTRELATIEQQRKDTDQTIGSRSQQIEHMAQSAVSQRNMQRLQNQRGELAELAEQWITQRAAQHILQKSIERFTEEHEPEMLQLARKYLSQLTEGRYTSVEHESGKASGFVLRNSKGEAFTPDRLSTGTREQLYLAIRMAYISHHCNEHEPLPVIMDDCFVNFDDQRTKSALNVVAGWSSEIQTVVLSCHRRVLSLVAEIAPSTPVIHLDRGETRSAGQLASESTLFTIN